MDRIIFEEEFRYEYNGEIFYISCAVNYKNKIFLIPCKENALYQMDMNQGKLEKVIDIPLQGTEFRRFSCLKIYKDSIWMIPWKEEKIFVYNMIDKKIRVLPIPKKMKEEKQDNRFRYTLQKNNILWIMPQKFQGILRVDMESREYQWIDQWPLGTRFDEESEHYFRMMQFYQDKILLYNDGCNRAFSGRFDIRTL
jgi:hypothetical protein